MGVILSKAKVVNKSQITVEVSRRAVLLLTPVFFSSASFLSAPNMSKISGCNQNKTRHLIRKNGFVFDNSVCKPSNVFILSNVLATNA